MLIFMIVTSQVQKLHSVWLSALTGSSLMVTNQHALHQGSPCLGAGVYANGGPSTVDKRLTMESLMDRDSTSAPAKQRVIH